MKQSMTRLRKNTLAAAIALTLPVAAMADPAVDALKQQVDLLQKQLEQVQKTLQEYEAKTATKEEVKEVRKDVAEVASQQSEWKNTDSVVHLAGYGDVTYSDKSGSPGAFSGARINPIFHYQYKDLVMLEGELEIAVAEDGGTELGLEYMTVDLFMNDYLTLLGGKFLSPLGQFRQNLHPSWINKLPTAPVGFGHDQGAPLSDVGASARGGFPVGSMQMNYAAYISNGPILEIEDGEIEAIEAIGRTSNEDGKFVFGGRLGLVPLPNSEVGISLASGQAAGEDETSATRDYDVFDVDGAYKWRNLALRGEYVKQKVGSSSRSEAPGSASWQAWYTQASYRFKPTKLEGVIRYSDYDANISEMSQKQWALGVNYLFSSNAMVKLAYNFNDGELVPGDESVPDIDYGADVFQLQFAYGF